jgi:hypothetical protein
MSKHLKTYTILFQKNGRRLKNAVIVKAYKKKDARRIAAAVNGVPPKSLSVTKLSDEISTYCIIVTP